MKGINKELFFRFLKDNHAYNGFKINQHRSILNSTAKYNPFIFRERLQNAKSFADVILQAFCWGETPEKTLFWHEIYKKENNGSYHIQGTTDSGKLSRSLNINNF